MTAIAVGAQLSEVVHDSSPDRIEVNVPDQFLEIGILLADNRRVPVLKKVSMTPVPAIETDRIARQQSSHERRRGTFPVLKRKWAWSDINVHA